MKNKHVKARNLYDLRDNILTIFLTVSLLACDTYIIAQRINNNDEIVTKKYEILDEMQTDTQSDELIYKDNSYEVPIIIEEIDKEKIAEELADNDDVDANGYVDFNCYAFLTKNAYLFADESFNYPIELYEKYDRIFVISTNGTWDYVQTESGAYGYMEPYLLEQMNENSYAYLKEDSCIYLDKELNCQSVFIEAYQKVKVLETKDDISLVETDDNIIGYIDNKYIEVLPSSTFIETDISEQTTRLYRFNNVVFETKVVTGKDSTPTDIGYFDIDAKQTNATLMENTFVNYFIPYNYGEGLHDADGWRSYYGDTEAFHYNGSHGCTNMPLDSVITIYNNCEVGDKVLVHK